MSIDSGDRDGWSTEPAGAEFDPRVILDFLRRRKLVILLVTVPLLLPATIVPFLLDSYYEAMAKVVIRTPPKVLEFGADFMPGAAGAGRNQGWSTGASSEEALITLVYSDAVLGRVIDQLPAGAEARKSFLEIATSAIGRSQVPLGADQDRARRVELLRKIVQVTVTGGGNYLTIVAAGNNGGSATFLANAVADAYVKYEVDQRDEASRRAVAWLNQQVYELREQAVRKEQVLNEIATTNNLSLAALEEDGSESQNAAIDRLEGDLQAARVTLLSAQQRLSVLRPRVTTPGADAGGEQASASVREQYDRVSAELDAARLRFTPTHPEVRRLEGVVASLAGRLGSEVTRYRPPLSQSEETEYQRLLSEESEQIARIKVMEQTRAGLLSSTAAGPKAEAVSRYHRLANEVTIDKQILEVLMTRRNETLLTAATKEVGADVLDYAVAPSTPAGPNRKKYLIVGYVLALGLGFGLAFALELIDGRMRDPAAIAALLGTTSLGMIPKVEISKAPPERQALDAPGSAAGESYRNVRTSLLFTMRAAKLRCLLVTSAIAGEGKTTTSVNLASAFGRMGRRVVLVDADMRRPRVHRVFRIPASPGLSEILQGKARVEDTVIRPERTEFDLIPAGAIPDNPSELLGSAAFTQLIADLKNEYDLVMLDSPVLLAVPDALLLAADADGTLIVAKPGSVDRHGLRRIRDDLQRSGARVLGVVFNQVDPKSSLHYPSYMYSPYLEEGKAEKPTSRPGA